MKKCKRTIKEENLILIEDAFEKVCKYKEKVAKHLARLEDALDDLNEEIEVQISSAQDEALMPLTDALQA